MAETGFYPAGLFADLLFFDIETAPQTHELGELNELHRKHWERRIGRDDIYRKFGQDPEAPDWAYLYTEQAAVHAEFGRVVCVSMGFWDKKLQLFRLNSYRSTNERELLQEVAAVLNRHSENKAGREIIDGKWQDVEQRVSKPLCGHNIKGFDIPYLTKRMLVNGLSLPLALQTRGKKPWDLDYIVDTQEDWKGTDSRGAFAALELLCVLFGVPSSKNALGGQYVGDAFYRGELDAIARYCEEDVAATAQVWRAMAGLDLLPPGLIQHSLPPNAARG